MKLSVSKLNKFISEIDLGQEIIGVENSEVIFLIGRSPECHVSLNDQTISREHAKIQYVNGVWTLHKLPGLGTLSINGVPTEGGVLQNGDIIRIGDFSLTVFLVQQQVAQEVAQAPIAVAPVESPDDFSHEDAQDATTEFSEDQLSDTPLVEEDPLADLGGSLDDLGDPDAEETSFPDETDGTEGMDFSGGDGEYADEYGEGEYSDEEYPVEEYDDDIGEKTSVAISFANINLEIFGEFAPYDHFNIKDAEVFIGRDPEKCQILLNDPEVSSIHAVIRRNNIMCTIEDLQSSNGTLLNGKRINKEDLSNNDEFIIGSTTFTVKIGSDFLEQQLKTLMPVAENQEIQVEEVVEIDEDELEEGDDAVFGVETPKSQSLFSKDALKDPQKRKKLLYILVGLLVLWTFLGEDEPEKPTAKDVKAEAKKAAPKKDDIKLTPAQAEEAESLYQLGKQLADDGRYRESIETLDKLFLIIKEYKNARSVYNLAKEGLEELRRIQEKEEKDKREAVRKARVKELVDKARAAVDEKNDILAEGLFGEILKLDPENYDVASMKLEIEAWRKKIQEEELAKAQKEAERKRQVDALAPGKNFYLKKLWYNATIKLEEFLRMKGIDEDLVKEGSKMLDESKQKLSAIVQPLLGKARSLKEGQDLKGAYETYNQILKYDPSSNEALNEMDEIRTTLHNRSMRIFREALISESLSRYDEAREKFQEVQQISPTDSEYYRKATEKLKDYIE
ncbi:FHA domain protein [Bacteriovorax sp. BSW11_IV]|uniref:FHA domain-containing protein n=1 Tax=Bacteriovorax sp. BSW11_IV TaxID=1353529 RepID=UPI00038A1AA8|nr:FHA domain-containing protein [Bacteriovorax sp. BSW11_IV]EQC46308.1 FHA domain protein [Bacteriovorax sp. BSW11_IV]